MGQSKTTPATRSTARRLLAGYFHSGGIVIVRNRDRRERIAATVETHLQQAYARHVALWGPELLRERLEPGVVYSNFRALSDAARLPKNSGRKAILALLETGDLVSVAGRGYRLAPHAILKEVPYDARHSRS